MDISCFPQTVWRWHRIPDRLEVVEGRQACLCRHARCPAGRSCWWKPAIHRRGFGRDRPKRGGRGSRRSQGRFGAGHDRCIHQHVRASVWPPVGPTAGGEGAESGERGMTVTRAFRYELEPTKRQQRLLAKGAGTARYAYNWGLALRKRLLDAGKRVPHAAELHRLWNAEKPQRSWVYGVSKCCGQEALRDLDRAFAKFWRDRKGGRRVGFPRFRRKHGRRDAFRLTGSIKAPPKSVTLPRLGCVRTKETTEKFRGRILSATVVGRRIAGTCRWRWRWSGPIQSQSMDRRWVWTWGSRRSRRCPTARRSRRQSRWRRRCGDCGRGARSAAMPSAKDGMPLSARVSRCEACGAEIDRDLNAARNLASLVAGSFPRRRETPVEGKALAGRTAW